MERGTQLRQHNNQLVVVIYPELYYYSRHFYVYIIKLLQLKHSVVVFRELKITSSVSYANIAKGITDPRVEFISQVQTQILIKFHLKNLDQASTSKYQPNISISTKLKLENLDKT